MHQTANYALLLLDCPKAQALQFEAYKQSAGPFEGFDAAASSRLSRGFIFNNGAFNRNAPARKHKIKGSRQMDFDKIPPSIPANPFDDKTINVAYSNRWKIKPDKIRKFPTAFQSFVKIKIAILIQVPSILILLNIKHKRMLGIL